MYKLGRSFGDTISLSAFIFIDKYYIKNFQIGSYFYQECQRDLVKQWKL